MSWAVRNGRAKGALMGALMTRVGPSMTMSGNTRQRKMNGTEWGVCRRRSPVMDTRLRTARFMSPPVGRAAPVTKMGSMFISPPVGPSPISFRSNRKTNLRQYGEQLSVVNSESVLQCTTPLIKKVEGSPMESEGGGCDG